LNVSRNVVTRDGSSQIYLLSLDGGEAGKITHIATEAGGVSFSPDGELDFRVPIGEGLAMFTALQRRGVESKLLYFPDEGHWISRPQNSELFYKTALG